MLDLRKRYNVTPFVLVPGEGLLAERCRENGIEVFVSKCYLWYSYSRDIKSKLKGIIKFILNKIYYYRKIFRLLKNHHFDIIHDNSSVTDTGSIISKKLNIPHVWHFREYGIDDYGLYYVMPEFYVRSIISKAWVIAISRSIYDSYVNDRKLSTPENTRIILNGLRISEAYEKKYMHGGKINFCIVGLLFPGKNQIMAVNACSKLKSLTDSFTLHIIGTGDENYINQLKSLVRSYGLDNNVKFWGFREDVNDVLRTMDVGLMLSRREAFGRVTVEYMLNYMPVIGTNSGGTPEIIIDGETGYIIPVDDSDRLAELMYKFIEHPELISSMGTKGRERAEKNFSLERNTDEIYSLYQKCLLL